MNQKHRLFRAVLLGSFLASFAGMLLCLRVERDLAIEDAVWRERMKRTGTHTPPRVCAPSGTLEADADGTITHADTDVELDPAP